MQNVSMSWLWNSYLQEVSDTNPLDKCKRCKWKSIVRNGLYAYGTPVWGNLARNYDTQYNVSAPYVNVSFDVSENLSLKVVYDMIMEK
jgi:hypothetical protein